jgi:eukaryotic-like serine/threonine-protein kinase
MLNEPAALDESDAQDAELARVLEACFVDIESGHEINRAQLAAEHPDIAERLQVCLSTLDLVEQGAAALRAPPAEQETGELTGRLGDFDIIREVGRGGMGVVYEAKQISLARRVALKVLPFAATLDPRQMQRFWMEAQAAAILHHVHIVPVFSVGCERGVHYYAMQFIEGQTLAMAIAAMRTAQQPAGTDNGATQGPIPSMTTERSASSPGYFRNVARLGVQAALALEHAHQLGVVHRDIKPSNLLLDTASNLWITDFGLARLRSQVELTLSGDTVGTLRYMSPEQALAKRGLVDHRTDVYSLGSTLYEALTLQPAYPGTDREEVLRRMTEGDPPPPRRISHPIPFELETIVLKAMAREPERRYATAQELADDLERFLEHRPVRAVRPGVRERITKWGWRHKSVLAAIAAVAALSAVGLLALTGLLWHEYGRTKAALKLAESREEEARINRQRAEANFRKAFDGLNQLLWKLENPQWQKLAGFREVSRDLTRQALGILGEFGKEHGDDPDVRFRVARTYGILAEMHLLKKPPEIDEAILVHRQAVAIMEQLLVGYPENIEYGLMLGRIRMGMGNWSISLKRNAAAREEYSGAIEAYRRALPWDRDGEVHNRLAFLLCDCLVPELRDPIEALARATQALALAPGRAEYLSNLAFAHYRAGEWRSARAALDKCLEQSAGGRCRDWLLAAFIAWRLGEHGAARKEYDKADRWLKKNPMTDELYHFRKEASELMGIRWPPES